MFSVAQLSVITAPSASAAAASAAAARRGGGSNPIRAAAPHATTRSLHHRQRRRHADRGGTPASCAVAGATSPVVDEECDPEDVGCTWEQLEQEVCEEVVSNVMATNVASVHPNDTVLVALQALVEQRLSGEEREMGGGDMFALFRRFRYLCSLLHHTREHARKPSFGGREQMGLWMRP